MALQLANSAEKALGDFFQQSNALEKLGRLYSDTLEGVERSVDTARPIDYTHSVLDLAVQKIVEDLSWRLLTEPDATPESVGVPQLVDLCVDGVVGDYLINSAPYKVLEDLMEGQTISTCEKLWEVLETRKQKLTSKHFIAEGPGRTTKASLCLLRMCNALLRRLSKTHNSVFCGKILLFLSFTFSLSERSAVNLTGKVNASNVTAFENQDAFEAAEAADIDKDASSGAGLEIDKSAASESGPIDYNLYRTFWGVQRFLRERELSTEDSEKFFQELNVVLAAFEGNAFSPDDLERTRDLMGSTASSGGPGADASDHYFQPKYLTNSRLFRLQLRDPILRETVLTQFLIQFNNLSNSGPARNNSALASKIQQLEKRVMVLLKQTPSDGEGFSEMVTSVLEREANWKKWKLDKCPPYEKFPSTEEDSKDSVTVPKLKRKPHAPLLTQILSESSQPSHILNRIKGDSRATAVPLATYMEKFTEAWDPENGIEEEYWPDKDEMHCWRTMRAAMRTSVNHLDLSLGGAGALVKGILGINDSKAAEKKDAPTEPPATSENDSAVEAGSEAAKKSSSETPTKRERSDSGRSVHSSEPPSKRERTRE